MWPEEGLRAAMADVASDDPAHGMRHPHDVAVGNLSADALRHPVGQLADRQPQGRPGDVLDVQRVAQRDMHLPAIFQAHAARLVEKHPHQRPLALPDALDIHDIHAE